MKKILILCLFLFACDEDMVSFNLFNQWQEGICVSMEEMAEEESEDTANGTTYTCTKGLCSSGTGVSYINITCEEFCATKPAGLNCDY